MANTTMRSIRVSDDVWDPAKEATEREGETLSDVVRRALIEYAAGQSRASEVARLRDIIERIDSANTTSTGRDRNGTIGGLVAMARDTRPIEHPPTTEGTAS
jgi:hypothetical protein